MFISRATITLDVVACGSTTTLDAKKLVELLLQQPGAISICASITNRGKLCEFHIGDKLPKEGD